MMTPADRQKHVCFPISMPINMGCTEVGGNQKMTNNKMFVKCRASPRFKFLENFTYIYIYI